MADIGVSDAPVGETSSAPAPSAPVASPAPSPGAVGTQPAVPAGAGTSATAGQFVYKEDRSNWVPSHVVRERSEHAKRLEQELFYERQRVAALSGVKPPAAPEDPEANALRQQFYKLFPNLQKLEGLVDKLVPLTEVDVNGLTQSSQQLWAAHGTQVLNQFTQQLKAVYGGADLPPQAVKRMQKLFVSEIEDDPQLRDRYLAGDLTVIDDFLKEVTGGILDPFRRSTAVAQQPRMQAARNLPRGGPGSAIAAGPPRPTVKPGDGDAFHKAAFSRFNQDG